MVSGEYLADLSVAGQAVGIFQDSHGGGGGGGANLDDRAPLCETRTLLVVLLRHSSPRDLQFVFLGTPTSAQNLAQSGVGTAVRASRSTVKENT